MSKEMLNDPHLKQNPYTVPEDYFRMVTEEWQMESAVAQTVEPEHPRLSLRSLFQFAASFALLFGIGYALFMLTGKNRADPLFTRIPFRNETGACRHGIQRYCS